MKILCIQLARLGDILVSAPALHALKREYPHSRIDLLVRQRFEEAAQLFSQWLNVRTFNTAEILAPIVNGKDLSKTLSVFGKLVDDLKSENYDLILNFSFSPFSSYLTKLISGKSICRGYTRYDDNTFAVNDFISGYFYSQVGIGKPNRLHLSDILAGLAGVSLEQVDWNLFERSAKPKGIVFHIGASQANKALTVDKMVGIVSALQEANLTNITLVGSVSEQGLANQIMGRAGPGVSNLCGHTNIKELSNLIGQAELVIGADSAPMHFATLSGTPCLNLSFPSVNFFESGPRSPGSRILFSESDEKLFSHIVANEALGILERRETTMCIAESMSPLEPYSAPRWNKQAVEWAIVQNAYFRFPLDKRLSDLEVQGINHFKHLNQLILDQYQQLETKPQDQGPLDFIKQAEILLTTVGNAVPPLQVLLRWLSASRTTVGPTEQVHILNQYRKIHFDLAQILDELVPLEENSHGKQNLSSN